MEIKIDTNKRYNIVTGFRGALKLLFHSHRIYLIKKFRKWVYENGYDKWGTDTLHLFVVFLMHNGYLNSRKIISDFKKDDNTLNL